MEYEIFTQGNKFRIYQVNDTTGKRFGPCLGEHTSEQDANDHLAELTMSDDDKMLAMVREAMRKKVSGFSHPAGDFLVVEDPEKTTSWHLPVKKNGNPDRGLAGAAWASLFSPGGYRGNKYEGPMKSDAQKKLKALYRSQKWEMPKSESESSEMYDMATPYDPGYYTARSFDDFDELERAKDLKYRLDKRKMQFNSIFEGIWRDPEISFTQKAAEWESLFESFIEVFKSEAGVVEELDPDRNMLIESMAAYEISDPTAEMISELTEKKIPLESGRRSPVLVDFQILHPGPGNKRDRHYYPAEMLERDIHVFKGADVFVTDHREDERSERTKVGIVKECPAGFTESKAPIAKVLLYDPDQAEKARNRNDAGELRTLECSIYGSGKTIVGEINGVKYNIVKELTEGKFLELVSKAGARGHAMKLSESDETEVDMKMKKEKDPADDVEEKEVDIHEQDASGTDAPDASKNTSDEPESTSDNPDSDPDSESDPAAAESDAPEMLSESEIKEHLKNSNLPIPAYQKLVEQEYADKDALEKAVASEQAYIKSITGSGKPNAGTAKPNVPEKRTTQEIRESQDAINKKFGF